jgi:hypothetical protein
MMHYLFCQAAAKFVWREQDERVREREREIQPYRESCS